MTDNVNGVSEAPEPDEFEIVVQRLANGQSDPTWFNVRAIVNRLREERQQLLDGMAVWRDAHVKQREANEETNRALLAAVEALFVIEKGGMIHEAVKDVASNGLATVAQSHPHVIDQVSGLFQEEVHDGS